MRGGHFGFDAGVPPTFLVGISTMRGAFQLISPFGNLKIPISMFKWNPPSGPLSGG